MIAEIVTIGSELLLGQVADTNFMFLSRELTGIGVEIRFRTTVGDELDQIKEALRRAMGRAELVVTAGGLGPTYNDLTRQAVAEVTGNDLIFRQELMEQIKDFYHRLRREPTEYDRRQAFVPEGAIPIANAVGTAPGFIVKNEGKAIISLSGVPAEVEHMTSTALVPFLLERSGRNVVVFSRTLKLIGASETLVERELSNLMRDIMNPRVGLFAFAAEIHICLTSRGETRDEAVGYLEDLETTLEEKFRDFIFGKDADTLESVVASELRRRAMTVALYETCTAGRLAQHLIEADARVITEARITGGLDDANAAREPARRARDLASRIRKETGASVGIATVGEAERSMPSSVLWVGISAEGRDTATTLLMVRSAEVNKQWSVQFALDQLRRFIRDDRKLIA